MSKVSIQGDQNGTGDFTIKAPNSNTDRTLNLPDEAGSVLTDVSDIESQVKTATNATGTAPIYACRAWVNFDGTGTVSIRDSGNVSSIQDVGIGLYTVNFATDMPDLSYAVSLSGRRSNANADIIFALRGRDDPFGELFQVNRFAMATHNAGDFNDVDGDIVCVQVLR